MQRPQSKRFVNLRQQYQPLYQAEHLKQWPGRKKIFFYFSHFFFAKLAFCMHEADLDVKKKPGTVSFSTCPCPAPSNLAQINACGTRLNCFRWRGGWSENGGFSEFPTILLQMTVALGDLPFAGG